jgi:glycosyltransferase involved in cell wall biosynthesis
MKVFVISKGMPDERYPLNGIFEFDQAKALAKVGHDVAMLVIDYRSMSYKRRYGCFVYEKDGVHVFELSLPLGIYRRALPILQNFLVRLYKKAVKSFGKPDIIHAHFYSIAAIASVLKKRFKIPFVITEHSSKLNKNILEISKIDARLARKAYKNADSVVAVSKALAVNLKNNFGVDAKIIPNIVDVSEFQYVKREFNAKYVFISVGNLIKIKGFDLLIEAFAEAFKDERGVMMQIVGDGPESDNLQCLIDQLGLQEQIILLGERPRNQLNEYYQKSDAFVLASRSETFGVAFIEAMATGLPVIATACGGPNDFVDEQNGYLIPVDDKQALVEALRKMKKNSTSFNLLEISEKCIGKFSPENIGNALTNVYQEFIR